jgi:hypothetical protein
MLLGCKRGKTDQNYPILLYIFARKLLLPSTGSDIVHTLICWPSNAW